MRHPHLILPGVIGLIAPSYPLVTIYSRQPPTVVEVICLVTGILGALAVLPQLQRVLEIVMRQGSPLRNPIRGAILMLSVAASVIWIEGQTGFNVMRVLISAICAFVITCWLGALHIAWTMETQEQTEK